VTGVQTCALPISPRCTAVSALDRASLRVTAFVRPDASCLCLASPGALRNGKTIMLRSLLAPRTRAAPPRDASRPPVTRARRQRPPTVAMAGRLVTAEQDILRLARAAKRVAVLGCATEQKVRVQSLSQQEPPPQQGSGVATETPLTSLSMLQD
jgi:hypothetical protein